MKEVSMKKKMAFMATALVASACAWAGLLDKAWIKGVTDKDPIGYKVGEKIVFTLSVCGLDGDIPDGEYSLWWKKSDDFGSVEEGKVPLSREPFKYETSLPKPGFVRLEAYVVDKEGRRIEKKFTGDATTPEGKRAMNRFESSKKNVFFDGGAGVEIESLESHPEPEDFDDFWARQFARLGKVPIKHEMVEVQSPVPKVRAYAVRVDCAGLRPVTGYLFVPKAVDDGEVFPCKLQTHGYSADYCFHRMPRWAPDNEIKFDINAHGLKLVEFGATGADTKALRWEVRSHDMTYAFDPAQNADPEVAYFNGMVLRVKRALQFLKTLKGWNGRDLYAYGSSQGGLQTIWAAGCGEGVTSAESVVTWCCDMHFNDARLDKKAAGDGWYIKWTDALGYYDPVNFAKRIPKNCRVYISRAGLGDYVCPPTGLAKLWNNIPGEDKKIVWVQGSEHGYVPPRYDGRDSVRGK